jgi:hypothetical protein
VPNDNSLKNQLFFPEEINLLRASHTKKRELHAIRIQSRSDERKLASYEVAGLGEQNKFVLQGTTKSRNKLSEQFPASFQDVMICGRESSHNVAG